MLNELLPENMWLVIKFAGTHPAASIIEEYHDKQKKEKRMNEAKERMIKSKLDLENFEKNFHKYQDELYTKKEILEKECKVCEKCIDIMNNHDCESIYDRCYMSEHRINIAGLCYYCLGCHFYEISQINIELQCSSQELCDYKDSAELAEWNFKHECAIYEEREREFLRCDSDIDDY
jgi:hypothetical protein